MVPMLSRERARGRWRAASFAILSCLCLCGATARAQSSVSVGFEAPEACPPEQAFRSALGALLANSVAPPPGFGAQVRIDHGSGGFTASVVFRGPQGVSERRLADPSCAPLVRAAALMVALAIDPGLQPPDEEASDSVAGQTPVSTADSNAPSASPEPAPDLAENAAPTAAPKTVPDAAAAGDESSGPAPALAVSVGGWMEWPTLPQAAFGAQAQLSLSLRGWRVSLAGHGAPARSYDARLDTELRVWLTGGTLRLGGQWSSGAWLWAGQLGVRASVMGVRAQNVDAPETTLGWLLGPEACLGVRWSLANNLGLAADLSGGLHLRKQPLTVANRGLVHEAAGGWLSASVGAFFDLR